MLNRYTFMPSLLHTICLQTYSKISLSSAGTQELWNFRSHVLSLPRAKVP